MIKNHKLFTLFITILICSCTDYIGVTQSDKIDASVKINKISATDSILSPSDASIVALIERHGPTSTKSNNTEEIDDIIPIYSDSGEVIMYAVNYKAGGYTIVSATKKYFPVLAKVEMGRFSNEVFNTGVSVLMEEYAEEIKYSNSLALDSLKSIRGWWRKYEEPRTTERVLTKSDPLLSLVEASIHEWEAAGITYTFLNEGCPSDLPSSVYQQYLAYAEGLSNPDYNYYTNCVIIGERTTYQTEKAPLLPYSVQLWGQRHPFNSSIPNNTNDYPIGCSAVATGQVMAYHQFPLYWNWTGIINLTTNVIGPYMYDIAEGLNTSYGTNGSSATTNSIKNYLSDVGYNVQKVSHNASNVVTSLSANRPVIMSGVCTADPSDPTGHAWVCDGYTGYSYSTKYTLLILSLTEPLSYEPCGDSYTYTSPTYRTFHMVWGWYGSLNGYYSDSGWPADTLMFNTSREDIINIYPNQ